MKILMVNKFLYPRGGSESYMLKLSEELKSLGHEVEYFGMYDEKNTVGNSDRKLIYRLVRRSKARVASAHEYCAIYSP